MVDFFFWGVCSFPSLALLISFGFRLKEAARKHCYSKMTHHLIYFFLKMICFLAEMSSDRCLIFIWKYFNQYIYSSLNIIKISEMYFIINLTDKYYYNNIFLSN